MNITIIGAGNTGLAMAAHSIEQGHRVTLWNRLEETISPLIETPIIYSKGAVEGEFVLEKATTNWDEALENPDLIIITTPSYAHKSLAENIAKHIKKETTIMLCPGRAFGALEFQVYYNRHNQTYEQMIIETQTAIYTCRKLSQTQVDIITIKYDVLFSALDSKNNKHIYEQLPIHIQEHLVPAESVIETSIGSVGMIVHCAPLLLNTGWTENSEFSYKYYREGITPSIAKFLEKLDQERIEVSKKLGYEVESVKDWLKRVYRVEGNSLYESIQHTEAYRTIEAPNTLNHRYITEDVPNGLVPIESAGIYFGVDVSHTRLIIDLACALLETDFRESGRNLSSFLKESIGSFEKSTYRSEV